MVSSVGAGTSSICSGSSSKRQVKKTHVYKDPTTGVEEKIEYFEEVEEEDEEEEDGSRRADGGGSQSQSASAAPPSGSHDGYDDTDEEDLEVVDESLLTDEERVERFLARYEMMVNRQTREHATTLHYLRPLFDRIRSLSGCPAPSGVDDGEDISRHLLTPTMIRRAFEMVATSRRARTLAERSYRRTADAGDGDAAGGVGDAVPSADLHVPLPEDADADDIMMFDRQLMMVLGELAGGASEEKNGGVSSLATIGEDGDADDSDEEGEVLAKDEVPYTFPEFVHAYKTVTNGMSALGDLPVPGDEAGADMAAGHRPHEAHRTYRLRTRERVLRMLRTFSAPDVMHASSSDGADGGEATEYTMSEMRKLLTVKDRQIVAVVKGHEEEIDAVLGDAEDADYAYDMERRTTRRMMLGFATFLILGLVCVWQAGIFVTASDAAKGGTIELQNEVAKHKRDAFDAHLTAVTIEKDKNTALEFFEKEMATCTRTLNNLQATIKGLLQKKSDNEAHLQACSDDNKRHAKEFAKQKAALDKASADLSDVTPQELRDALTLASTKQKETATSLREAESALRSSEDDLTKVRSQAEHWKHAATDAAAAMSHSENATRWLALQMEGERAATAEKTQKMARTVAAAVAASAVLAVGPPLVAALLAKSAPPAVVTVGVAAAKRANTLKRGGAIVGRFVGGSRTWHRACEVVGGILVALRSFFALTART
mmetsp:Transcript_16954/g.33765  ORF Transcript_16954/g.33765 Transcript_16954/m.33765 type:complete len:715 (-) Transcript_16954:83-2227(-)